MRASTVGTFTRLLVVIAVVTLLAGIASAQVNGALQTTTSTGTVVDGNIYNAKTDVYITGGPQNENGGGLVPADDTYYFMVTDPDGKVLLSTDDISCRQVVVSGGKITGVTGPCPHLPGTLDAANSELPVQLYPFKDTPNPGGEYKAWITPAEDYSIANCSTGKNAFGFCTSNSKTDNFKILQSALISVCKFQASNSADDVGTGDPLLPHWLITATTSWGTSRTRQTRDDGCIGFSFSPRGKDDTFPVTVTLSETLQPGWTQTAPDSATIPQPQPSQCTTAPAPGTPPLTDVCILNPGDIVIAPYFGNLQTCTDSCPGQPLIVSKTAIPSYTETFTWGISKKADTDTVFSAGGGMSGAVNYTVTVTHDNGAISNVEATGVITVANPNRTDVTGVKVTDGVDNGGSCTVANSLGGQDPTNATIPAGKHEDFPYTCKYPGAALPDFGTNTATAAWDSTFAIGTATVDFTDPSTVITVVDGSVTVTDTLDTGTPTTLGTVSYTDPSPTMFTYSHTFTDPNGACTTHKNTATFTATDNINVTGSAGASVQDCQGANLTISKQMNQSDTFGITKTAGNPSETAVAGGTQLNFVVTATATWSLSASVTITNPNNWESVAYSVSDPTCSYSSSGTLSAGQSLTLTTYPCPITASGTDTATVSWDSSAVHTTASSASANASWSFPTLTVTDAFNGGTPTTLGTITAPTTTMTWNKSYTVNPSLAAGACQTYKNTATITDGTTSYSSSASESVCKNTGGLTMGYWGNKNGQAQIIGAGPSSGTCSLTTYLRTYLPFQDLSMTAPCGTNQAGKTYKSVDTSAVTNYVESVINFANASGASMNAMLKAQMLSTALDAYFSSKLASTKINLEDVCTVVDSGGVGSCSSTYQNDNDAFNGNASMTVAALLTYAGNSTGACSTGLAGSPGAANSNIGGSAWYCQNKTVQGMAKNVFDAINNDVAFVIP